MRKFLSTAITAAIILSFSAFGAEALNTGAAGTVATAQGKLYVRSSPGGSIISSLSKGSNVTLIDKTNNWYKIEYNSGKYGYSSSDYIKEIDGSIFKEVKTSYGRLNVRNSPAGTIINSLASGSKVAVIDEIKGWSKVVYNGNSTGYVSSQYLKPISSSSTKYKSINLSIPDFKQTDSRWSDRKIGSTKYTIGQIGCTTTALAMSETYRTGKIIYPDKMEDMLTYSSTGILYWPSNYTNTTDFKNYLTRIYSLLEQGKPVIIGAKKADLSQHWVIVTGCKETDYLKPTDFIINDPGSTDRKNLGHFFSTYHYLHRIVWYK